MLSEEESDVDLKGLEVLLVEDNSSTRTMVRIYFECHGIIVHEATNGVEAIRKFNELHPDVCVVDIGLPDRNGFEVAEQIRLAENQPLALIAMTGYGLPQDREKASKAGFDLHLIKPVDPERLVVEIRRVVNESTKCK